MAKSWFHVSCGSDVVQRPSRFCKTGAPQYCTPMAPEKLKTKSVNADYSLNESLRDEGRVQREAVSRNAAYGARAQCFVDSLFCGGIQYRRSRWPKGMWSMDKMRRILREKYICQMLRKFLDHPQAVKLWKTFHEEIRTVKHVSRNQMITKKWIMGENNSDSEPRRNEECLKQAAYVNRNIPIFTHCLLTNNSNSF